MVSSKIAFFGLVPSSTLTPCGFLSAVETEVLTTGSLSVGSNTAGSVALQVPGCDLIVRRSERIESTCISRYVPEIDVFIPVSLSSRRSPSVMLPGWFLIRQHPRKP